MPAYIINFTDPERTAFNVNPFTSDGPVAPNTLQLSSSAVRASTSLLLYGKGHADYGERIQENLINLMENFSGATEPTFPISGQTWFSRITYALTGSGSPATASTFFRWEDDSTLPDGGSWMVLTAIATPVAADDIRIGGSQPTTVVDGSFWYDTSGSPPARTLNIGVNNTASNLTAAFLPREYEDLTGLLVDQPGRNNTDLVANVGNYLPQKQLKVYDGNTWKNAGNVFTSDIAPQSPTEGDMWFNTGQNDAAGSPTLGSPAVPGPQNQLFIWESGQWRTTGYVDTGGDVMTGTLQFGLPTSSLFLWEGQGSVASGADLRMTGDALLTAGLNFYIHINDAGSPPGNQVFEVAARSQSRGAHVSLFQVRNDGLILSALGGSPYSALLISEDNDAALVNWGSITSFAGDIAQNTININILNGGGDISAKVDRDGDTMTGVLTFAATFGSPVTSIFGSPQIFEHGIDMGDLRIINLQTASGGVPEDAVNVQFLTDVLTGSPSPLGFGAQDGVVNNILWEVDGVNVLTLTRTEGLANLQRTLGHEHSSVDIPHTVDTPFLRDSLQEVFFGSPLTDGIPPDLIGSPPDPLQPSQFQINSIAVEDLALRLASAELPKAREIFHVGIGSPRVDGGSPAIRNTQFSFTHDSYVAGTHRLTAYVNGVKQYANERAHQHIEFNTNLNLSSSAQTYLARIGSPQVLGSPAYIGSPRQIISGSPFIPLTYTLQIVVDGGSPAEVMIAQGNELTLFQDIVNEINTQITGVTSVWNFVDKAIDVYSNTTGTNSAIDIFDFGSPIGTRHSSSRSLLGHLSITPRLDEGSPIPGAGSPKVAYIFGNIVPIAGSPPSSAPITFVDQNLAYFEAVAGAGSPAVFADASFGDQASTVVFNAQLSAADVLELLYEPVS